MSNAEFYNQQQPHPQYAQQYGGPPGPGYAPGPGYPPQQPPQAYVDSFFGVERQRY
jgi:hypothetical protein